MAQDLAESRVAPKPSLPPRLKSLVTAPITDSFGPYGWEPKELPWNPPAVVPLEQIAEARALIPAYERFLAPPSIPWISGRIATLLTHYFIVDMPKELAGAALRDWVDVLGDLPQHAIQEACLKWLRMEPRKRPGPGDIRDLAVRMVRDEMNALKRLRVLAERGDAQQSPMGGVVTSIAANLGRR